MNDSALAYVDWKDWEESRFGECSAIDAVNFAAETGGLPAAGARVLEIGFGNGNFLGWVRQAGADVFGVETNPRLVERALDVLGPGHAFATLNDERLTSLRGSFSLIAAFDVLEHLSQEELPNMLRGVRELLAADGRFIVRFPNGDSPFGRILQHGDPTHINTIGRGKLEYFARSAGLRLERIRDPALPAGGVGAARALRRLLLKLGRSVIERVVARLYFGGRRVSLDPNYVAILVRSDVGSRRS